jgi:hypothetical protein
MAGNLDYEDLTSKSLRLSHSEMIYAVKRGQLVGGFRRVSQNGIAEDKAVDSGGCRWLKMSLLITVQYVTFSLGRSVAESVSCN